VTSKSKDPIAAACVYLACRMENYPRTMDEVSFSTGVDVRTISKMQQAIARKLQLSIGRLRPQHLVNRFAAKLHCPHAIGSLSLGICENITRLELLETHAPQLIAAGSLVVASLLANYALDISELSIVSLVSMSSIKQIYRSMHPLLLALVSSLDVSVSILPGGRRTVQQFPNVLDKSIVEDKLILADPVDLNKAELKITRPNSSCLSTAVIPRHQEDQLADLVRDLTDEVVVPARPSANNLTFLLQEKKEQIESALRTSPIAASLTEPSSAIVTTSTTSTAPRAVVSPPTVTAAAPVLVNVDVQELPKSSAALIERKRCLAGVSESKSSDASSPLQKIRKVVA